MVIATAQYTILNVKEKNDIQSLYCFTCNSIIKTGQICKCSPKNRNWTYNIPQQKIKGTTMQIINDFLEVTTEGSINTTGEGIYVNLAMSLEDFAWALPAVITDKFGVMTEEEQIEKAIEIAEFMQSSSYKDLLKAKQLKALCDTLKNSLLSIVGLTENPTKAMYVLTTYISYLENENFDEKTLQDLFVTILNKDL